MTFIGMYVNIDKINQFNGIQMIYYISWVWNKTIKEITALRDTKQTYMDV